MTLLKWYFYSLRSGEKFVTPTIFQGPELLTGGSAGMEGSLIAVLVATTFTVVVLILAVRRGKIVPPSWPRKALA